MQVSSCLLFWRKVKQVSMQANLKTLFIELRQELSYFNKKI